MNELQKLITNISKQIQGVKPFSWQTLVFLGLFSWLIAFAIANSVVEAIIYRIGWIFLTLGLAWALEHSFFDLFGLKIYPGPWITGALVAAFVLQGIPGGIPAQATLWPLISAAIALTPLFLKHSWALANPLHREPKKLAGDRQGAIIILLFSILLSCWIQFYYLLQIWFMDYPSLRVDTYDRSAFVTKLPITSQATSRGVDLLNATESVLQQRLRNLSWLEVEQWLQTLERQVEPLQQQAQTLLPERGQREDPFWLLQAQVLPGEPDYTVRFRAFWRGPSSQPQGYYAQKICQISQTPIAQISEEGILQSNSRRSNRIACQPATDRNWVGTSTEGGTL